MTDDKAAYIPDEQTIREAAAKIRETNMEKLKLVRGPHMPERDKVRLSTRGAK